MALDKDGDVNEALTCMMKECMMQAAELEDQCHITATEVNYGYMIVLEHVHDDKSG
jgi:hypothetical protein